MVCPPAMPFILSKMLVFIDATKILGTMTSLSSVILDFTSTRLDVIQTKQLQSLPFPNTFPILVACVSYLAMKAL